MKFTIAIIGLGLMGGSLAKALQGFRNSRILGVDTNPAVREKALAAKAVHQVFAEISPAVEQADVTIFCTYPESIMEAFATIKNFKKGSCVTEICGIKRAICEIAEKELPPDVNYIGIHPMAGKEVDGFDNSDARLFTGTGFIITPIATTTPESIALMESLATYIKVGRICLSSPLEHDEIIAYTSDLMHISAAALCMDFHEKLTLCHTAGAFRDCTRIANLNPELWTELFLANQDCILEHLNKYIHNLTQLQTAIQTQDRSKLFTMLDQAQQNKKGLLTR